MCKSVMSFLIQIAWFTAAAAIYSASAVD